MKPSHVANDNQQHDLIQNTKEDWQPRLGRDLCREQSRQIAANVAGFFTVLADWSRAEIPNPANDAGTLNASGNGQAPHDR